jgi:hypothetical protein
MTLIIQKPTTSKLILAKDYVGIDDPDAAVYVAAVEAADEAASPGVGALETATKVAIHSFVKGCKADGIWPAIKASCILAGARTLTGALVPLAGGTAPTNVGGLFVSGDYNRKTGLKADGTTKYLNSNRGHLADPRDNSHFSVFCSQNDTRPGSFAVAIGSQISGASNRKVVEFNAGAVSVGVNLDGGLFSRGVFATGLIAGSRNSASTFISRNVGSSVTHSSTASSTLSPDRNIFVFALNNTGNVDQRTDARLAFYSIGESLDLALLDARVTDLINAFAAAIP